MLLHCVVCVVCVACLRLTVACSHSLDHGAPAPPPATPLRLTHRYHAATPEDKSDERGRLSAIAVCCNDVNALLSVPFLEVGGVESV